LQSVAVRCSVLQCVAVCCSVLQCVAVHLFWWFAHAYIFFERSVWKSSKKMYRGLFTKKDVSFIKRCTNRSLGKDVYVNIFSGKMSMCGKETHDTYTSFSGDLCGNDQMRSTEVFFYKKAHIQISWNRCLCVEKMYVCGEETHDTYTSYYTYTWHIYMTHTHLLREICVEIITWDLQRSFFIKRRIYRSLETDVYLWNRDPWHIYIFFGHIYILLHICMTHIHDTYTSFAGDLCENHQMRSKEVCFIKRCIYRSVCTDLSKKMSMCRKDGYVLKRWICVKTMSMCEKEVYVWKRSLCVKKKSICGKEVYVWKRWICVKTMDMRGKDVYARKRSLCVEKMDMCGNDGYVWKRDPWKKPV